MLELWVRFLNRQRTDEGASLVEYAFLLLLIALVVILVVTQVGENTSGAFSKADKGFQ